MKATNQGVFVELRKYVERRRLGELLVVHNIITPQNLRTALNLQKQTQQPLGQLRLQQII